MIAVQLDAETAWAMRGIRAYLRRHPRAADTRDGIARCWLRCGLYCHPQSVQQALDRLVAAGTLGIYPLPSGEPLYYATPPRGARFTS